MKCYLVLLAILISTQHSFPQDSSSHYAAAEELLVTMRVEENMNRVVDVFLPMLIKANPNLAEYSGVIRNYFLDKLRWDDFKNEYIRLYVDMFSESELREMIAFYRTETGKKVVVQLPLLMAKAGSIGQERLQNSMHELETVIRQRMEEQEDDN